MSDPERPTGKTIFQSKAKAVNKTKEKLDSKIKPLKTIS